ncbi:uncharacterized protein LOC144987137 [Oryzias latipes]
MPVNSSSTIFQTFAISCSKNASLYPADFSCFNEKLSILMITSLTFTNVLLSFPLCVLIFCLGFGRWRQKSSAPEPNSHTDVFTYCMAAVDMTYMLGLFSYFCNLFYCSLDLMKFSYYCVFWTNSLQTLFHFLTCIERYLAVVHPITYMRLKQAQGVRVRNAAIACVFLLSFGLLGVGVQMFPSFPSDFYFFALGFNVVVVLYCTLAIFCVLRRPGLGSDKSKRRAFHTVMAITVVLLIRFFGQSYSISLLGSPKKRDLQYCESFFSASWLSVPSSLVLPVLFIQRREMMTQRKRRTTNKA